MGEWLVFADVLAKVQAYSRPSVVLVAGQHRGRLTVIEPAMDCDAGPTLNRNWVGRPTHRVYVCRYMRQPNSLAIQVLNRCWPAPAMVVGGIHVEDIFELVSLVLSLIISWTIRILTHELDQYSYIQYKIVSRILFHSTQTD